MRKLLRYAASHACIVDVSMLACHGKGWWAQYSIDLPGSLLDRDNGRPTFTSSNTDVVEKVYFLVAASQHGGTSGVLLFWSLFKGILSCGFPQKRNCRI